MRPEAKFSDGTPITAEDVVFTFTVLPEKGVPSYKIIAEGHRDGRGAGRPPGKVHLQAGRRRRATCPRWWAASRSCPKHYYDTVEVRGVDDGAARRVGRLRGETADPGRQIEYCRNPDYWGKDLPVNVGPGNFDCFGYEYYADRTAAFEAFKAGGYTVPPGILVADLGDRL